MAIIPAQAPAPRRRRGVSCASSAENNDKIGFRLRFVYERRGRTTLVVSHNSYKVRYHIIKLKNGNQNELTVTSLLPVKGQYSPINGKEQRY